MDEPKTRFKLPSSLIPRDELTPEQSASRLWAEPESSTKQAGSKTLAISTPQAKASLYDKLVKSSEKPMQYELLPWESETTPAPESQDIPTTDQMPFGKNLDQASRNPQDLSSPPKFVLPTHMVGAVAKKYKPPTPAQKLKKTRVSLEGVVNSVVDARHYRGSEAPNGHWDWPFGLMGGDSYAGFIYVIHDKNVNRLYLGKKSYRGRGKLNKGEESNWRWYISSSEELANNVKAMQKVGFDYYCIEEYRGVGALSFAETWSLCTVESPSNKDIWYNVLINKISWPVREKITDRHKQRLQEIVRKVVT